MIITREQLKQIVPRIKEANLSPMVEALNALLPKYDITTRERVCCFIAQVAHESAHFNAMREFASGQAYEGRKDLGNIHPGDGVKFKGRGLLQTTGRSNYRALSLYIFKDERLLERPELVETLPLALESACYYWRSRKLNEICDLPDTWTYTRRDKQGRAMHVYTRFQWLTRLINGGLNGIDERTRFYITAKKVIT
jgi:putative chitinase